MNPAFRVKLIASAVLLLSLAGSGVLAPVLAASVGRFGLAYTDRAEEGDPPQVALGIAMGAFRGIFVNFLWIRANDLKEAGRFHESIELANTITRLQPRFPRVWAFHAWNLAYNVSVTTQTPQERWQWVNAGVDLLRDEGIPANPNDMFLHKELAWIYLHKVGGYTDDANQYYKRRLAEEWHIIVGPPPSTFGGVDDSRDAVIQRYVDWLTDIADAPNNLETLLASDEKVAQLWDALAKATGDSEPGEDLLRRYSLLEAAETSVWRNRIMEQLETRPNTFATEQLRTDPQYAAAWPKLISYARRNVIENKKHMSVNRMIRFTKKYGPIDWRLPGAHGLYWAAAGVEQGLVWARTFKNSENDFVNTDRIVLQSIQELYRGGELYFNFLDFASGLGGYYQATPNRHFIRSYGDLAQEVEERGGIFESDARAHRQYAAGYENFLTDAIIFLYRRGDIEEAQQWYSELRTFENQNMNDQTLRAERFSVTLDEFVIRESYGRWEGPAVAVQNVIGSLQGAMRSMIRGDVDAFEAQLEFATKAHAYFFQNQFRRVVASSGTAARMEWMDRDFRIVAGEVFYRTISSLPLEEAASLYARVPDDLRRFAYDLVAARYEAAGGQEVVGATLGELFPEPPGMEAHRARMLAREAQKQQESLEGINRQ